MAVTSFMYGNAIGLAFKGDIDFDTMAINAALLTSAHTKNQDTHSVWGDISANEVSGSGYTAGGKAMTGVTWTYDAATNLWKLTCANYSWTTVSVTARFVAYYVNGTVKSLLAITDLGEDRGGTNVNINVTVPTGGIFTTTTAVEA